MAPLSTEIIPEGQPLLALGPLHVDLCSGTVRNGPVPHQLRPLELALLRRLYQAVGDTVHTEVLLRDVWGYKPSAISRTVASTMARLRAKIEPDPANPRHLITVHGEGYALRRPAPVGGPLLGRERLLQAVEGWLRRGRGNLLTLYGVGGIGKSSVLSAIGQRAGRGRPMVYVDLEAEGLAALRIVLSTDEPRFVCVDLGTLSATVLEPLLQGSVAPHTVVLASRAMLDHQHEAALPVPPLDPEASLALLGTSIAPAFRPAVLDLCAGLPLALQLARDGGASLRRGSDVHAWFSALSTASGPLRHRSLEANLRSTLSGLGPAAARSWSALPDVHPDEAVIDELVRAGAVEWEGDRLLPTACLVAGHSRGVLDVELREVG